MTKYTMRNTKVELLAAIRKLQDQLAEAQHMLDEANKYADEVSEELRQATAAPAEQVQPPAAAKPQAPARPVTDRGAVLATMREFAVANNCPTRLRDGVAQYYSYRVNAWLDI